MIELFLLGIFSIIISIISVIMFRNRIIFKLGFRNILKRKGFAVIVILGLMVGTGIISSALVIGDTMENMIETEVLESLYLTDEVIVGRKPTGQSDFFNETIFFDIKDKIDNDLIDGISRHIATRVAVLNTDTDLSEASVSFSGIDFANLEGFGNFITASGQKITSLKNNQIMIGKTTAEDLDAEVGHKVVIYTNNTPSFFTVTHILKDEQRAGNGIGLFVSLEKAQQILNKENQINQILVSNKGGVYEGMEYTDEFVDDFKYIKISHELDFEISIIKKDTLENGKKNISQFSDMFFIFGTFSIIAGIILIINIFVMLSEERKSEMGMMRAIGMQRKQLKRMYLAEGTIYALIASLVGVFFGIIIAYIIIYVLKEILSSFGNFEILSYFAFTSTSLIIGFVAGFILTIITIYLTSNRISKLNIVRAIRNIPEPKISKSDNSMTIIGSFIVFLGGLCVYVGINFTQAALFISGLSLTTLGLGIILRRWLGDKFALNLIGIIIFIIWIIPSEYYPDYTAGIEMFIISGLFLVFASLIIVITNSEIIIKGLTFILGRGKSFQAVIKTAISYALKSKFRTGMTIAIFALVIFTITTMSMIVGLLGTNIENQVQSASGGYDIIAFCNPLSPIENIEDELIQEDIYEKIDKLSSPVSGMVTLNKTTNQDKEILYNMIGVDDKFINENEFEFAQLNSSYKNAEEAWDAIKNNKDLIIIDGTVIQGETYGPTMSQFYVNVGDKIKIKNKNDTFVEKEIIGIVDSTMVQGIISYKDFVIDDFNITQSIVFLISANENVNVDELAKEIESSFLSNGMQAFAIKTMVLEAIETMNQFFYLFDAFMALGLIIGIAGLGIITIRSVHERRQEIGMMRAIGFNKKMILSSFLIETSIVSILGILIGTFLGIFTGYIIWREDFQPLDFEFFINWEPILIVGIIAFVFTMLCIIPASRKAARIPPAEALRYEN